MILSVSRRTDVPSYYSEWFFNRLEEGFVCVRNPMNIHRVSRIEINKDVIDGIVFWTKNPKPMLPYLEKLNDYPYYFQFTLNPYSTDIETNLPSKKEYIIPTFIELSKMIGKERVVWRYDPIIVNEKYTFDYHIKYFNSLAKKLSPYTEKCTISFIDLYRNTCRNMMKLGIKNIPIEVQEEIAYKFSRIAGDYGLEIDTCCENIDLSKYGIGHAACVDIKRLERIGDYKLKIPKDKNQRCECGCFESIDIGAYNTCKNGCKYCYANFSPSIVDKNYCAHNINSPLLLGELQNDDVVTDRRVTSNKIDQFSLF